MAETGIAPVSSLVDRVAGALSDLASLDGPAPDAAAGDALEAHFASTGNMRADWDARARTNARFFIECTHHASEEEFDRSGEGTIESVVLRNIGLNPRATVLEIGCGIGRLLKPLASRARELHGVDVSGEMIAQGRRRLAGWPSIHLHLGSGSDLETLQDAYFDLCYSFIVFQHVPDKAIVCTYLAEAFRVLKPGGLFRFQVDGRHYLRSATTKSGTWEGVAFEEGEITEHARACGFEILETTGAETQYLIVTARRPPDGNASESLARFEGPVERARSTIGTEPIDGEWRASGPTDDFASSFAARHASLEPEAYVRRAYRSVLGREPDPQGLVHYVTMLGTGALDYRGLLDTLLHSAEFTSRGRLELGVTDATPDADSVRDARRDERDA
jgi:SAM-dependent methyltransferase